MNSCSYSHSRYVDNHPECKSDLAAYLKDHPDSARRLAKRASHHDMAKKLAKKGQQTYYIIAVDHILVRLDSIPVLHSVSAFRLQKPSSDLYCGVI